MQGPRLVALFWLGAALAASFLCCPLVFALHVFAGPAAARAAAAGCAAAFVLFAAWSYLPRRRMAVPDQRAAMVVVSGCDSGFGEHVARACAAAGFTVLAGCLTAEGARALGGVAGLEALQLDVTRASDVAALAARVRAWRAAAPGRAVHALVNNAGIGAAGPVDWCEVGVYERVMAVNFLGHVAMTKALLPLLYDEGLAAAVAGGVAPRVVNVTSVAGLIAAPSLSAYAASKFALEAFSDSLRRESAAWGLRVALIEPSFLRTPMVEGAQGSAQTAFAALPPATQARWGAAWAEAGRRAMLGIVRSAEPAALGAEAILAAVLDAHPRARYRAGTPGVYLLPYIAALPAPAADAIMALSTRSTNARATPAAILAARKAADKRP